MTTETRFIEDAIAQASHNGSTIAVQRTTDADSRGDAHPDAAIIDISHSDGTIIRVIVERIVEPRHRTPEEMEARIEHDADGPYTREEEEAMSEAAIVEIMARIAPRRERDADITGPVNHEEASMIVTASNGVGVGVMLSVDWP